SLGDPGRGCRCTPHRVLAYQGRISGPLLDRIDLKVETRPLRYEEMSGPPGEATAAVAERVRAARVRQQARAAVVAAAANAELKGAGLRACATPDPRGQALLAAALQRQGLTARGHDRVLRVARTVADLEGAPHVAETHVAEALQFRMLHFG